MSGAFPGLMLLRRCSRLFSDLGLKIIATGRNSLPLGLSGSLGAEHICQRFCTVDIWHTLALTLHGG